MIIKRLITFILALSAAVVALGQQDPLFKSDSTLDLAISLSVKNIKETKGDTTYVSSMLYVRNDRGIYDSLKVGLKGRGNSRLDFCYFPPLWIKIKKKQARGTLFENNKKLKLVLPCRNTSGSNDLILKEWICYKLYELVTPYAFKTRLVNVELTEILKKKTKSYKQKGIIIEDADKTARRFDAKLLKDTRVKSSTLNDTA